MSAAIDATGMNLAANNPAPPPLPRAAMPLLLTAAALITALFAGRAIQPALNRPLTALRIDGALTQLSPAQIAAAAAVPPHTHIFDADLNALRTRVEALPWVGRVRVSRVWPDRLDIRVWERVPSARWGQDQLLDTDGAAFAPPARDLLPATIQALPQLSGPASREAEVMGAYRSLSESLQSSEFVPQALSLDARGEWRMNTASGIALRLGDGDPLAHVPLLLGTVSRTLAPYMEQIAYIDLRYTNGFSVGWISGGDCDPARRTATGNRASSVKDACVRTAAAAPAKVLADDAAAPDASSAAAKPAAAKVAAPAPPQKPKPVVKKAVPPSASATKTKAKNSVAPAAVKEGKK